MSRSPRILVPFILLVTSTNPISPANAGPPLSDYVIFAAHDKVTVGGGSLIHGLVGSGFVGTLQSQRAVLLNASGDVDGDVRATWNIQLNNGCFISGSAIHTPGTTISMGNPAGVGSDVAADPELPLLPPATGFVSGGPNYTGLGNGANVTIPPGSYGTVSLGGAVTVNLTAGDYYFDSFTTGNGADLVIDLQGGQINIYVTGQAKFGNVDVLLLSTGGPDDIYLESHWVETGSQPFGFTAGAGSDWIGNIFTPYSGIHYGGSAGPTTFNGRFVAGEQVDIEHGVTNVELPTPITTSATWGAVKAGIGQR